MKKITLTWGNDSIAFRVNERTLADELNRRTWDMGGYQPFPADEIVPAVLACLSRRQLCYAEKIWGVKISFGEEGIYPRITAATDGSEYRCPGITTDVTTADIYALTGAMRYECTLERDIIAQLIGKRIKWSAPVAADNAKYGGCGGTAIIRAYKPQEHNPLDVETIKGDNLGWAFFDGPGEGWVAYGDGDRCVSFKILGDN
jgi:hypothetical protein